jgi:hypothetical protein
MFYKHDIHTCYRVERGLRIRSFHQLPFLADEMAEIVGFLLTFCRYLIHAPDRSNTRNARVLVNEHKLEFGSLFGRVLLQNWVPMGAGSLLGIVPFLKASRWRYPVSNWWISSLHLKPLLLVALFEESFTCSVLWTTLWSLAGVPTLWPRRPGCLYTTLVR